MNCNNEFKIALVIKTQGLEYDDRVRKEILSVQKLFPNISFKIYAMLGENKEYEGITNYGIPYKSVYLKSREAYPSSSKLLRKAYEFYSVIRDEIKQYDAVWCGDRHCFFVPMCLHHKRILWDLHELPYEFFGGFPKKQLLKYIFNRCKVIVHANPQRCDYLYQNGYISNKDKHFSLRNYPNFNDVDVEYDDAYYRFIQWKDGRMCVYFQGLSEDGRAAYESIEAVMRIFGMVAVVVGSFHKNSLTRLENEWGAELEKRIFFAGRIAQLKIPQYVKECYMSMVFYKNIRPNNFYCEANRFYQSVIMGLPVVVGSNAPMKELVEKYGFGISIDDDGCDINKIIVGIQYVLDY